MALYYRSFIFVYICIYICTQAHFRRDLLRWNGKHYSQFTQFTLSLVLPFPTSDCYCCWCWFCCCCCCCYCLSWAKSLKKKKTLLLPKHPKKNQKSFAYIFTLDFSVFYLPLYLWWISLHSRSLQYAMRCYSTPCAPTTKWPVNLLKQIQTFILFAQTDASSYFLLLSCYSPLRMHKEKSQ